MGWIADLLKEIPSAARYKAELEKLEAEVVSLRSENVSLKTHLANTHREIERLNAAIEQKRPADRQKPEHDILLLLVSDDGLTSEQIAAHFRIGEQAALHHLTELKNAKLHLVRTTGGGDYDLLWWLHDGGRAYLAVRGELK